MKQLTILLLFLSSAFSQLVQFSSDLSISKEEYKQRREALMNELPDNPIVFIGNVSRNRINDTDYEFRQESNFLYFTGFNEPNAYLIISKKPFIFNGQSINELIFVQENNLRSVTWTGKRLGTEGVKKELGIENATESISGNRFTGEVNNFEVFMKEFVKDYPKFHLMTPNIDAKTPKNKNSYYDNYKNDLVEYLQKDLIDASAKEVPETKIVEVLNRVELSRAFSRLRGIKSPKEIEMIQRAVDITASGHQESFKIAKHVDHEYQVEAAIEFGFKFNGAEDVGYNSIVGCGENGTILHYETNRDAINHNQIFCLDAGAEYHGYTADITRSFPANGTFSKEQKEIYDIVLAAQAAGAKELVVGSDYGRVSWATQKVVGEGLDKLGIIEFKREKKTVAELNKDKAALRSLRFAHNGGPLKLTDMADSDIVEFYNLSQLREVYPHGWGHHVGLDVHDAGEYEDFKAGMIWTIEPGIYISNRISFPIDEKYLNIGIRIEDMYLITENGNECMSDKLPRTTEDIEAYMKKKSTLLLNSSVPKR